MMHREMFRVLQRVQEIHSLGRDLASFGKPADDIQLAYAAQLEVEILRRIHHFVHDFDCHWLDKYHAVEERV
jgi:hypothetical protein